MKNFNVKSCTEKGYRWVVRGKDGTGCRTRKYFHVKQEAQAYAERKNIECENQGLESLAISTPTRIMAQEAERLLSPFGKTIKDAVAFYIDHLQTMNQTVPVQKAIAEFLETKTHQKKVLSVRYRNDLKNRLTKFAKQFVETPVANIQSAEIEQWLNGMQICPVTHDNYHRILSVFFAWAKKNRYTNINPIDEIRDPEPITKTPGIFTPEEATALLNASTKELLPYLAFSLFCGIRPEEFHKTVIRRAGGQETKEAIWLDWAAVNFAERNITISAELAKTHRRRIVTLSENLIAWLAPLAQQIGPIAPSRFREKLEKLRKEIEWKRWPHDVLRHSFCTYHLALYQNEHQTALQAGNSPQILRKHYDAVATHQQAEAYFAIVPTLETNLVPFVAA